MPKEWHDMIPIRIASFIDEIATIDYYNVGRGYMRVKFTLWDVGEHYVRSGWNNNSPTHQLTNSPWNFTLVWVCTCVFDARFKHILNSLKRVLEIVDSPNLMIKLCNVILHLSPINPDATFHVFQVSMYAYSYTIEHANVHIHMCAQYVYL